MRWCYTVPLAVVVLVVQDLQAWTTTCPKRHSVRRRSYRTFLAANHDKADTCFDEWSLTNRDFGGLEKWACDNGILMENGFQLSPTHRENQQDWNVVLSTSATKGDRILHIPKHMIFSADAIQQQLQRQEGFQAAVDHVTQRHCQEELPQFFLWIQLLQEFEKGQNSTWYPWIQALPRHFGNALYMDDVELECLPPYAWSLAKLQLLHLEVFPEALNRMPSVVSAKTRADKGLARWALSVVFTRCWGETSNNATRHYDCHVAPVGDMLNHFDPATTFIDYDGQGNCNLFLKENVQAGSALSLSYGRTSNPSRFLALYGFVDLNQAEIFSQILVTNPSQMHKDIGYDVNKMTLGTKDGSIAEAVFDVTLFSILEQVPEVQTLFYQAHIEGDKQTVHALRQQFHLETCILLKKHIDSKLVEIQNLLQQIDRLYNIDQNAVVQHERLPVILEHNMFLYETFAKAKSRIDTMIQEEMKRRKAK